jgi:hypothetical protein
MHGKSGRLMRNGIFVAVLLGFIVAAGAAPARGSSQTRLIVLDRSIGRIHLGESRGAVENALGLGTFMAQTGRSDLYTVNADGTGPYQVTQAGLGAGLKDWGTHPLTR